MKPAQFSYHRAGDVAEALTLLERYDGEAKLLAGGQSLVAMTIATPPLASAPSRYSVTLSASSSSRP